MQYDNSSQLYSRQMMEVVYKHTFVFSETSLDEENVYET